MIQTLILRRPVGLEQVLLVHLQIVESTYTQMLFVSPGTSQHKVYLLPSLMRNVLKTMRYTHYEIHTSIVDKPYIGHSFPGFKKYVKAPRKVPQFNSFQYPPGYSQLLDKGTEVIGITSLPMKLWRELGTQFSHLHLNYVQYMMI